MTAPSATRDLLVARYEVELTIAWPYQPWQPAVLAGVCDGVEEQTGVRPLPRDLPHPTQVGALAEYRRTLARKYRWAGHVLTSPPREWTP